MSKIKLIKNESRLEAIEQKAGMLFKQKGYVATSMKDIAEQIGIEAPSLYNHIHNKADLLHNICFSVAGRFEDEMNLAAQRKLPAYVELEEMLRFHIQMMLNNFTALWVANHEWKHLPIADLKPYIEKRKAYEKKLRLLIEQGIADKRFSALDPRLAGFLILAGLRGLEFWQKEKQLVDLRTLENNIIQQLLKGITQ